MTGNRPTTLVRNIPCQDACLARIGMARGVLLPGNMRRDAKTLQYIGKKTNRPLEGSAAGGNGVCRERPPWRSVKRVLPRSRGVSARQAGRLHHKAVLG